MSSDSAADLLDDVVVRADRYADVGVLLTLRTPADVPRVVARLGDHVRAGWRSVLVPGETDPTRAMAALGAVELAASSGAQSRSPVAVPVRYDGADLAEVAAHAGVDVATVVALHARATYTVVLLGFGGGFAYLSGLPEELCGVPRRATPRTRVPAGSVAIAGDMAGIYPTDSPGGWALLGQCDGPPTLRPGDRVRFTPA